MHRVYYTEYAILSTAWNIAGLRITFSFFALALLVQRIFEAKMHCRIQSDCQ